MDLTFSPANAHDATATLAQEALALKFDDLLEPAIARAEDLLLDHLGVALLGLRQPWTRRLLALMEAEGGTPQAAIYGGKHVPMRAAALVNGTAGHAIELDDTHDESLNHPGSVVWPAALAVGEALRRDGREVLAAAIAGYEVQCRIGAPLGQVLIERGFHPTATCGVFGATAAAGSLLRLDETSLVSAFGCAASMSSGVMQFAEDPKGTMIKRMHGGMPAERGVLAAQLAAVGFSGPAGGIDGRYGFARVFAGRPLPSLKPQSSRSFEIERVSVKLYPCCKLFHSLIEAIQACKKDFDLSDIATIEPSGPHAMIETHMVRRPESTMSAQYSLPYTVAVTLALDVRDPAAFEEAARANLEVQRLAELVTPSVDSDLQAVYPARFAGGIRITLHDGREFREQVIDSRSSPGRPLSRGDVVAKFLALTRDFLPSNRAAEIVDAVFNLRNGGSIGALLKLIKTTD